MVLKCVVGLKNSNDSKLINHEMLCSNILRLALLENRQLKDKTYYHQLNKQRLLNEECHSYYELKRSLQKNRIEPQFIKINKKSKI